MPVKFLLASLGLSIYFGYDCNSRKINGLVVFYERIMNAPRTTRIIFSYNVTSFAYQPNCQNKEQSLIELLRNEETRKFARDFCRSIKLIPGSIPRTSHLNQDFINSAFEKWRPRLTFVMECERQWTEHFFLLRAFSFHYNSNF